MEVTAGTGLDNSYHCDSTRALLHKPVRSLNLGTASTSRRDSTEIALATPFLSIPMLMRSHRAQIPGPFQVAIRNRSLLIGDRKGSQFRILVQCLIKRGLLAAA